MTRILNRAGKGRLAVDTLEDVVRRHRQPHWDGVRGRRRCLLMLARPQVEHFEGLGDKLDGHRDRLHLLLMTLRLLQGTGSTICNNVLRVTNNRPAGSSTRARASGVPFQ